MYLIKKWIHDYISIASLGDMAVIEIKIRETERRSHGIANTNKRQQLPGTHHQLWFIIYFCVSLGNPVIEDASISWPYLCNARVRIPEL